MCRSTPLGTYKEIPSGRQWKIVKDRQYMLLRKNSGNNNIMMNRVGIFRKREGDYFRHFEVPKIYFWFVIGKMIIYKALIIHIGIKIEICTVHKYFHFIIEILLNFSCFSLIIQQQHSITFSNIWCCVY